MEWTDDGIILGARRHGETSVIAEIMTRAHGRHMGLVRGGRSRRHRPVLQAGNGVIATWRARLEDHLGTFSLEPTELRAAKLMEHAFGLHLAGMLSAHLRLLPERDPHPQLFAATGVILDTVDDRELCGELLVRFELALLEELGFGLDLSRCAATGTTTDLIYVSPKSGRAISGEAGSAYRDKLLPLPAYLIDRRQAHPDRDGLDAGFRLTGYFLDRDVYHPRGIKMTESRLAIVDLLTRNRT